MKETVLKRMSFSIEEELFDQLEILLAQSGYGNRSEFIRDMIRKQLTRKQCSESGQVIGTVSVLCNLKSSGIETKLLQTIDRSGLKTLGISRFALENDLSTTMISVEGIGCDIRDLVYSVRKLKGVVQAEFVITSAAGCQNN